MLMLDLAHPVTVTDGFLRILHTIIGSLLALLSGYLFFPMWESRRLPAHIAEALRAEAAFLGESVGTGMPVRANDDTDQNPSTDNIGPAVWWSWVKSDRAHNHIVHRPAAPVKESASLFFAPRGACSSRP
jgi:hypothetical protein